MPHLHCWLEKVFFLYFTSKWDEWSPGNVSFRNSRLTIYYSFDGDMSRVLTIKVCPLLIWFLSTSIVRARIETFFINASMKTMERCDLIYTRALNTKNLYLWTPREVTGAKCGPYLVQRFNHQRMLKLFHSKWWYLITNVFNFTAFRWI